MARRTVLEELVVLVTGDMTRYQRMIDQFNRQNRIMTAQTNRLFHRFGTRVFMPIQHGLRQTTVAVRTMMRSMQASAASAMTGIQRSVRANISRMGQAIARSPMGRGVFNAALGARAGFFGARTLFRMGGRHPGTRFSSRMGRWGAMAGGMAGGAVNQAVRFGAATRAGYTGMPLMTRFGRLVRPDMLQRAGIKAGAAGALAVRGAQGLMGAGRGLAAGFSRATHGLRIAGGNLAAGFAVGLSGKLRTGAMAKLGHLSTMAGKAGFIGGAVGRQVGRAGRGFASGLMGSQVSHITRAGRAGQMAGGLARSGGAGVLGGGAIMAGSIAGIRNKKGDLVVKGMARNLSTGFARMKGIVSNFGGTVISTFAKAFGAAGGYVSSFFRTFGRFASSMAYRLDMIGRRLMWFVTLPLALVAISSVRAFAKFDDAIQKSVALLGGVSEQTRAAMESTVAAITSKSITAPTELAEGYITLASAGFTAAESMKVLGTVEKFAVASMMDMKDSTTSLIGVQSALGKRTGDLATDTANMTYIADVMTRANQISQGTIEDFADALTNKGAAALRLLNKPMEEGVAVLAAFASQNVKGAGAGEKLYIVLRDLQRAAIKQPGAWARLGIHVFDASGKMNDTADIIAQMERAFGGMSDEQKRASFMMLGLQDRSVASTMQLLGMSNAMKGFREQLDKADGAMQKVVDIRLKSFSAQMAMLRNRIILVGHTIGKALVPIIMWMGKQIDRAIVAWNALSEPVRRFAVIAGLAVTALGPFLLLMGVGLMAFTSFISSMGVLGTLVMAVAGPIGTVIGLIVSLAATTVSSGLGLVVALITTILGTIASVGGAMLSVVPLIFAIGGPVAVIIAALTAGIGTLIAVVGGFGAVSAIFSAVLSDIVSFSKKAVSVTKRTVSLAGGFIIKLFNVITGGADISFANICKTIQETFMKIVGFFHNFTANMQLLYDWIKDNWRIVVSDLESASLALFENMSYNARVSFELIGMLFKETGQWLAGQMKLIFVTTFIKYMNEGIIGALNALTNLAVNYPTILAAALSGDPLAITNSPWFQGLMMQLAQLGADAAKASKDSLTDRFGKVLKEGPQFKHPLEGFQRFTPPLPKFLTDLPEVAKAAVAPVDAVGKALTDIVDIADDPIDIEFGVKGIDAVVAGSAEFVQILMNTMAMAGKPIDANMNARQGAAMPADIGGMMNVPAELKGIPQQVAAAGAGGGMFNFGGAFGAGSGGIGKAGPTALPKAAAVHQGQGGMSFAPGMNVGGMGMGIGMSGRVPGGYWEAKRRKELERRERVRVSVPLDVQAHLGAGVSGTLIPMDSLDSKANAGGSLPVDLQDTNGILDRILETMEMNNELIEKKGGVTIEPANLA